MVAYNFHPRFIPAIEAHRKRQTIRPRGRRRHATVGDDLQLYTGQRTPAWRLIARRVCCGTWEVDINLDPDGCGIDRVVVGGQYVEDLGAFARAEGFGDMQEMSDWWGIVHGPGRRHGLVLVRWRLADAEPWNRLYPAGTRVRYEPALGARQCVEAVTGSEAWTMPSGDAVVCLLGMSGCYALRNIDPVGSLDDASHHVDWAPGR